ncbi:MAG TPA: hypothetical protein VLX09_02970 [Stellaceae bacterium]|nr:hypothetical protein [Stellaceae bacterium]
MPARQKATPSSRKVDGGTSASPARLMLPLGAGAALMALFCGSLLALAGTAPTVATLSMTAAEGAIVIGCGMLALGLCTIDEPRTWLPLALVIGTSISCLVVVLLTLFGGMRAGTSFLVWGVLVAASLVCFRSRIAVPKIAPIDLAVVAALAASVVLWCRLSAGAYPHLMGTGLARIWIDYFIHGTELEQFGGPIAAGHGSALLVGAPFVFYHYGAFMPASAIVQATGISGFAVATAILLPLGLLIAVLGIYALGASWANRWAGLLATAVFACLPDPSFYGLRNGYFSDIWLAFTAPNTGYALGASAALLTLFRLGGVLTDWRRLLLVVLTISALFELSALFFVLVVPLSAFAAVWTWLKTRERRQRSMLIGLLLMAAAAALVWFVPVLSEAWLNFSAVQKFITTVHEYQGPTAYDGVYTGLAKQFGPLPATLIGYLLLVPCILGGFLFLYPLALLAAAQWQKLDSFDLLPLAALVIWLGIVLIAPAAPNGDVTVYTHRSFPLVYQLTVIATVVLGLRLLTRPVARIAAPVALALLLMVGVTWTWPADPARPLMGWGRGFYDVRVPAGILEAAQFLRTHAQVGDVIAVTPLDLNQTLVDPTTEIVSLAGVPAVVGRVGIQVLGDAQRRAETERRVAVLERAQHAPDIGTALTALHAVGATWWVVLEPEPAFNDRSLQPSFRGDGVTLFRLPPV